MHSFYLFVYVPFLECSSHAIRISSEEEVEKFGEKEDGFCNEMYFFFNEIVVKFKIQMMMPIKNESFMRY